MPYSWVTETVYVVHTPGHSKESISLLDTENQLLLTGDYLYTGPLYVYLPGASMQDYLDTARNLLAETPGSTLFRRSPNGATGATRIVATGPHRPKEIARTHSRRETSG